MAEKLEPDKKKMKTMIHAQDDLPDDVKDEEGAEQDKEGEPDMCQHVKEREKFDHYATDAATEEQSKEQASNMEQEKETPKEEDEKMDIDMHEDEEAKGVEDEAVLQQNPEKVSDDEKSNNKKESKEKGKVEHGKLKTHCVTILVFTIDLNFQGEQKTASSKPSSRSRARPRRRRE